MNRHRILQIHPTRRCNLQCLHCYSLSGPDRRGEISQELLCAALTDAKKEGYSVASFSGGEPTLYTPLPKVLEHAQKAGMITTVTTNGMFLDKGRMASISETVNLLAISLDGTPESHNRMRASKRAFEAMEGNLEQVRRSRIPFGFIFTLTQFNVNELDWVANFAVEQGASLLQIHPLEEEGRAIRVLSDEQPDQFEGAVAYMEVLRIQSVYETRLRVHLDLADREVICQEPERIFATRITDQLQNQPLAELVSPLVIYDNGTMVPIQYGFAKQYELGNLHNASLSELGKTWRMERFHSLRELCRRVLEGFQPAGELPFINWYEVLRKKAKEVEEQGKRDGQLKDEPSGKRELLLV